MQGPALRSAWAAAALGFIPRRTTADFSLPVLSRGPWEGLAEGLTQIRVSEESWPRGRVGSEGAAPVTQLAHRPPASPSAQPVGGDSTQATWKSLLAIMLLWSGQSGGGAWGWGEDLAARVSEEGHDCNSSPAAGRSRASSWENRRGV